MAGAHTLFWPAIVELFDGELPRLPRARPGPLAGTGGRVSLLDRPLGAQAEAIAAGDGDPAELLEQRLERFEERNPALNAVVATFPEQSREMLARSAGGAAARGTGGDQGRVAAALARPAVRRVPLLRRIRARRVRRPTAPCATPEAVIAGVANMHELGSSSTGNTSVYGPAHNPWDLERCPGGSSSGPGAAVGGRLVAAAVGADGIGSIRYPAAYCGVTGLKPTFGRSAMEGHHLAPVTTTIVSGPLAPDASGCRLLGSVLFGEELPAGDAAGLRIGVVRSPISEDCQPAVREACEEAIEALRAETGGEVTELDPDALDLSGIAAILVGSTGERRGDHAGASSTRSGTSSASPTAPCSSTGCSSPTPRSPAPS